MTTFRGQYQKIFFDGIIFKNCSKHDGPKQQRFYLYDSDAHLPSIVEQPSAYEQTGQLSKNNAGGPHHAINEADGKNTQIP